MADSIVIVTRVSENQLNITYCNDLDAPKPTITTSNVRGLTSSLAAVTAKALGRMPDVGQTLFYTV